MGLNQDSPCFAATNSDPRILNRTIHGPAKRGRTKVLHQFAGDKAHLTKPGSNAIEPVDADNLGTLSRFELVEGSRQGYRSR